MTLNWQEESFRRSRREDEAEYGKTTLFLEVESEEVGKVTK